jgi:hypothetical protein
MVAAFLVFLFSFILWWYAGGRVIYIGCLLGAPAQALKNKVDVFCFQLGRGNKRE